MERRKLAKADSEKESDESIGFVIEEGPIFEIRLFEKRCFPMAGYLSTEAAAIFAKEPKDRTEDDIDFVEEEIKEIGFFKRFPYSLQRNLSKVMFSVNYTKGQVVVKEGREASAMYIVITGILRGYKETFDEDSNKIRNVRVSEISHGMTFGEKDLMHGTPRDCTVKCRSIVQLLRLDKEHFDSLIRGILTRDEAFLTENLKSIKAISEFDWEKDEFENLKKAARLEKYPANTVILGGVKELPYYVHFVASGVCVVEQEIEFIVEHGLGYKVLKPASTDSQGVKVHKTRLEICHLRHGHYFGMGEDLSSRYVRSTELVEIIMIPRQMLLLKKTQLYDRLRGQYEANFPVLEQILDKYLELLNWQKFKRKTTKQIPDKNILPKQKMNKPRFVNYF